MSQLTIMIRVNDVARADIALTGDRTYYRFATESSVEDGDLNALPDLDSVTVAITEAAKPRKDELPLSDDVRLQLFVDNVIAGSGFTEESLRRVIAEVSGLYPEFAFVEGFR